MHQAVLDQKRTAAEAGAQLVVLLFPFNEQTYWDAVKPFATKRGECDPDRPYRMLAALCRSEGIPVLALTNAFREQARQNEVLYLRDDAHWNEAGNALAGRVVTQFPACPRVG
jgi:hypothetical protein